MTKVSLSGRQKDAGPSGRKEIGPMISAGLHHYSRPLLSRFAEIIGPPPFPLLESAA